MHAWESFFVAQVGASAALAGLIFVGISLNLTRILSIPNLPTRGIRAMGMLIGALIISSVMLIPEQPVTVVGVELVVLGLIDWLFVFICQRRIWREVEQQYRRAIAYILLLGHVATLPFVLAGILTLTLGWDGVYWMVPGIICSLLCPVINAWILLVEINR